MSRLNSSLLALVLTACGAPTSTPDQCAGTQAVAPGAPVTRFALHLMAGQEHLRPGVEVGAVGGLRLRPTKARFYVSEVTLVRADGTDVGAELVDEHGRRQPYELALVDLEQPASHALHVKAPAGHYRGLRLSVGVPRHCSSGEQLNHADASAMRPPLDVDSDMYWSWNAGYVFLKFEGQVFEAGAWERFFFHVGGNERFARVTLDAPFVVEALGGEGPALVADFNQLLTAPEGFPRPDVGDASQRRVHGGAMADELARNLRESNFLRGDVGHP